MPGKEAGPPPHFDPETGCPTTAHGEQIVANSWLEEAARGKTDVIHNHDFRIPYTMLQAATQDFSESMSIGGGGSCLVYKGSIFGVDVAIKALKMDQGRGPGADESKLPVSLEGKQFFAEMKLLQVFLLQINYKHKHKLENPFV